MKKTRQFLKQLLATLGVAALLPLTTASAFQFDTGNSDFGLRWDNTLKYSAAYRVKDHSATLVDDLNYDDGDRNFGKGFVSNRLDLLSELDASFPYGGIRLSGAAWYDTVYNQSTDHEATGTFGVNSSNNTSVAYNEFTDETKKLHGRNAELLDAFVYTRFDMGEVGTTLRAGRHTLIYGETLFFGANGIAEAQGPIDLVKLLSVPSSQFKEVLRPVEQISTSVQITPNFSIGAYYQLRWHETLLPAAGSYLSNADIIGEGSESWNLGTYSATHLSDRDPKDSGQGGIQLRYSFDELGIDVGLYAARYHAKTPSGAYVDPVPAVAGGAQAYRWVYAEDIDTFGASATGSIGQLNWATEVSFRHNTPLNSDPQFAPGILANDASKVLYAVGNTAHANLSGIYVMPPTALWDGGSFVCELAYNTRLSVSENENALAKNTTKEAWATRMIFEPTYFQVASGLDLSFPVGLGWNFAGRSSAISNFNGGSSHGGDASIGVNATYHSVWKAGLSYVKRFGEEETFTVPHNSGAPHLSFKNSLADRDFVAFNITRSF